MNRPLKNVFYKCITTRSFSTAVYPVMILCGEQYGVKSNTAFKFQIKDDTLIWKVDYLEEYYDIDETIDDVKEFLIQCAGNYYIDHNIKDMILEFLYDESNTIEDLIVTDLPI